MIIYNRLKLRWQRIFIRLILINLFYTIAVSEALALSNSEGFQVYQKNVHMLPERKRKLANDVSRYRNADNLWDVLREDFTLPHYENHPAVQSRIEWYMNNQDYLLRAANRAAPYLYYISQQIKKRHLPAELVLLPIVESGYNPFSRSSMGAAGIWQLMPETAAGLGVKHDRWFDGRRDIIASTRAALNYLVYLQNFFDGNWLLAIAAYNTGEGNVQSAIRKNIRSGRRTHFWSLPLAQETRSYVPSLLALAVIISRPDEYPVYLPPVRNAPYLAQIDVKTQINLKHAASLAGISHKKLMRLNPGFSLSSTAANGHYKLILPIENVAEFTENFARLSPLNQNQLRWAHYKVKSGDTLHSIARRYRTTVSSIRKLNHLKGDAIKHGADMLIPQYDIASAAPALPAKPADKKFVAASKKILAELNDETPKKVNNKQYHLNPGDTIYMVRKTDTLESIANRFHLNSSYILQVNRIDSKGIKTGVQLILPTHSSPGEAIQAGDTIYIVRHGDSIEKIAQKFRTSPAAIRLANLIDDNSLKEGEKILVPARVRG